jgi:hypothetical protein
LIHFYKRIVKMPADLKKADVPKPAAVRKPSLKEMPSYLKEMAVATNRRQELLKLKERLSNSKLILSADPASKPWLLARQISSAKLESVKKPRISPDRLYSRSSSSTSE